VENMGAPQRPQMPIKYASCVPTKHTIILIALLRYQWLRGHALLVVSLLFLPHCHYYSDLGPYEYLTGIVMLHFICVSSLVFLVNTAVFDMCLNSLMFMSKVLILSIKIFCQW